MIKSKKQILSVFLSFSLVSFINVFPALAQETSTTETITISPPSVADLFQAVDAVRDVMEIGECKQPRKDLSNHFNSLKGQLAFVEGGRTVSTYAASLGGVITTLLVIFIPKTNSDGNENPNYTQNAAITTGIISALIGITGLVFNAVTDIDYYHLKNVEPNMNNYNKLYEDVSYIRPWIATHYNELSNVEKFKILSELQSLKQKVSTYCQILSQDTTVSVPTVQNYR